MRARGRPETQIDEETKAKAVRMTNKGYNKKVICEKLNISYHLLIKILVQSQI